MNTYSKNFIKTGASLLSNKERAVLAFVVAAIHKAEAAGIGFTKEAPGGDKFLELLQGVRLNAEDAANLANYDGMVTSRAQIGRRLSENAGWKSGRELFVKCGEFYALKVAGIEAAQKVADRAIDPWRLPGGQFAASPAH